MTDTGHVTIRTREMRTARTGTRKIPNRTHLRMVALESLVSWTKGLMTAGSSRDCCLGRADTRCGGIAAPIGGGGGEEKTGEL